MKSQMTSEWTAAPVSSLVGRACLVSPYLASGLSKALNVEAGLAEMRQFNLEPAAVFLMSTISLQLVASLLIICRRMVTSAACALIVFTLLATLVAHDFWSLEDALARSRQANAFLANLGLIGGLAVLAGAHRS